MLRKRFLMIALLLMSAYGTFAQETPPPFFFWSGGDLYRVEPNLVPAQLTASGTISSPVISPDETRIAYKQAALVGIEALDRVEAEGEIADIDLPADIAVLDVLSGASTLIAGQPEDAALFEEGTPDNAIVRSAPAWSPDGIQLAWTEFNFGAETPRLMIHDLTEGTTSVLVPDIAMTVTQGQAPSVRWGDNLLIVNLSADAAGEQAYLIVSPVGTQNAAPRLAPVPDDYVLDVFPVEGAEQTYVGVFYASGRWTLLDGQTGVGVPFRDVPHLLSRRSPENSLRLRFDITPDMGMFWEVLDTNMAYTGDPNRVTLSPDGQAAVFLGYPDFDGAAIWSSASNAISAVPNTGDDDGELEVGAVIWGSTMWEIDLP